MSFTERLPTLGDSISFTSIRNIAVDEISHLSRTEQDHLYEELARGINVLDDDAHLNMYLRCFGLMHRAKAEEAFKNLPKPKNLFSEYVY